MTDLINAERLREYFLTHEHNNKYVNVCDGLPNWNVCDYGDIYAGKGLECWKQDGKHDCIRCKRLERKDYRA